MTFPPIHSLHSTTPCCCTYPIAQLRLGSRLCERGNPQEPPATLWASVLSLRNACSLHWAWCHPFISILFFSSSNGLDETRLCLANRYAIGCSSTLIFLTQHTITIQHWSDVLSLIQSFHTVKYEKIWIGSPAHCFCCLDVELWNGDISKSLSMQNKKFMG